MVFVKARNILFKVVIAGLLLLTSLTLSSRVFPSGQAAHVFAPQAFFVQTNLVSDLPNIAVFQDPHLVNPWGLAHGPDTPWWVADNGKGVSTVYDKTGRPFPRATPLVVTIPPPPGSQAGATGTPTGLVFNAASRTNPEDFVITANGKSAPSIFLFATEDGTIAGWNPQVDATHAILAVDHSTTKPGAVYKGLAMGQARGKNFIYATNFRAGVVEMFDGGFHLVQTFTDPQLASTCPQPDQCFAPFGIQNIRGTLFVTFALQQKGKKDDQAGPGNGFVDIFDTQGRLLRRFASRGTLNSPWGVSLAPNDFGPFSNTILVGNFGDGRINGFDPRTGTFNGQLANQDGNPFVINGLWSIAFGNGGQAGERDELFFTAGLNDEANGLFGKIQFVLDDDKDWSQQNLA